MRRPPGAADRFRAWLVTGSLARGAAFVADLAVLAGRSLRRESPQRRGR